MKTENFKKWVIGAGLFNIIAAFPLSMPFTISGFYSFFNSLNHFLGLGESDLVLPQSGGNLLWLNTCGLALVLVGLMLIYASKDLKNRVGIPVLNGVIRIVFGFLMAYYVATTDISRILISIAFVDVLIGMVFLSFYWRLFANTSATSKRMQCEKTG